MFSDETEYYSLEVVLTRIKPTQEDTTRTLTSTKQLTRNTDLCFKGPLQQILNLNFDQWAIEFPKIKYKTL